MHAEHREASVGSAPVPFSRFLEVNFLAVALSKIISNVAHGFRTAVLGGHTVPNQRLTRIEFDAETGTIGRGKRKLAVNITEIGAFFPTRR